VAPPSTYWYPYFRVVCQGDYERFWGRE